MMALQWLRDPKALKMNQRTLLSLCALGLTASYVTNVAEIWAIQSIASSKVCLLYSLSPFVSALLAYFILKEKLNKRKWLGLIIGMFGLAPIFYIQNQSELLTSLPLSEPMHTAPWPELVMLIAVLTSAYGWILLKKIIQNYHVSFITANGVSMFIGGSLSLLHSFLSGEPWEPLPVTDFNYFLKSTLLICFISNFICYNLYGYLLKKFSATFMSFAGLMTPLFAAFFGHYFLGEQIDGLYYIAIMIFSIGLGLFYKEEISFSNKIRPYHLQA